MGRPRKIFVSTGQRFGRLVCLDPQASHPVWQCLWKCDCGTEKRLSLHSVVSGNTKSCGCLHKEMLLKRNRILQTHNTIDLSGQRFGRLVALSQKGSTRANGALWECVCDCGVTKLILASSLRRGVTKSCGCLQKELQKALHTKHGRHKDKDYLCAIAAKRRALKRGATVEFVDPQIVYERDMGLCQICGLPVEDGDFSMDHRMPLSRGGEHSYANCGTAHASCNSRKRDKLPGQYAHLWMRS